MVNRNANLYVGHHQEWHVTSTERFNSIVFCLAGMAVLLIGAIYGDARDKLSVAGIPIGLVTAGIASFFLIGAMNRASIATIWRALVLLVAILPLLWTNNNIYGLYSLSNLFLSYSLSSILICESLHRLGERRHATVLVAILTTLLFLAILWKIRFGLFNREVLFFLNGPIVFSRLMGAGLILTWLTLEGKKKYVLALLFLAGVVWTESKGPLMALILTAGIGMILGKHKLSMKYILPVLFVVMAVIVITVFEDFFSQLPVFERYFKTIDPNSSFAQGSWGTRIDRYIVSFDIIAAHPFTGVGLGNWASATGYPLGSYPHNLFLEVFSEMGIFIGTLFLLPYVVTLPLRYRYSSYYYVMVFFLFASQVSGDLLDSRYVLVFATLTAVSFQTSQTRGQ